MIRDRGKMKWQGFLMPEHIGLLRQFAEDSYLVEKPMVDERIAFAMEYHLPIKITIWEAGRMAEVVGRVHFVDPITKQLRIERDDGDFERLNMTDVVGVEICD